ncbi:dynein regulatory complex protein 1 [Agrilus planipennis]|uniref:Dynein regulatory complex protein 1 n=1 Tax=Agrilus planipennis TaxID=224129 RepID=A0A1W4X557_AGRPL|nr:dynein regulatory complex protein 1 [Agrilus planipennis]
MDAIDDTEEQIEREPSVSSPDPFERKLARRLRIQRRAEAIRRQNLPEEEIEEVVEEPTLHQQQYKKSTEVLEKLILQANQLVTNVRVASDSREADRREIEGIGREKIIEQLEEEAKKARDMFDEIADKWLDVLRYNDPLAINDDIANQKEKCDELIRQKDEIIAMLKNEIAEAEKKFSIDQRKQTNDINVLTKRIEKQVTLMRAAYLQELKLIEEVLMVERRMMIDAADKRWEDLYKKRDEQEASNEEKKFQQMEEFEEMMHEHHLNFQERYRDTKIKIERDTEDLQKEFERLKAEILLNSEKMDYNYQVLKRREDENVIIKAQQKRKINKMQDAINAIRTNMRNYITKTDAQFAKLTEQIIKLQHYVLDTDEKSDTIARQNDEKFKELWDFNYERLSTILHKILTIDRILHEQQLGIKWKPPEREIKSKEQLQSYQDALKYLEQEKEKAKEREPVKKKSVSSFSKDSSICSDDKAETNAYRRLLKQIFTVISMRSNFLLDEELQSIFKTQTNDEKTMVKIDGVFEALRVKDPKQIEILVQYFLPYAYCPICRDKSNETITTAPLEDSKSEITATTSTETVSESENIETDEAKEASGSSFDQKAYVEMIDKLKGTGEEIGKVIEDVLDSPHTTTETHSTYESDGEMKGPKISQLKEATPLPHQARPKVDYVEPCRVSCERHHPLMISSIYALRALRDFADEVLPHDFGPKTMTERLSNVRRNISRLLTEEDIKFFWMQFRNVFSPTKEQLWDGLMFGLQKYHEILKDRKKISEEVLCLRHQNNELKRILETYDPGNPNAKPPCPINRPHVI